MSARRTIWLGLSLALTACATAPAELATSEAKALSGPSIEVRPQSNPSDDLFAIEDPLTLAIEARWNGEAEKAYTYFSQALMATPKNKDVAIGFADMAIKTGRAEKALETLSHFHIDPETSAPKLLSAIVLAEIASAQSPDAELRLNQALERAPTDPRLWNALGQFHDQTGNPLRAQDAYLTALATGRADASVINNLGMSLLMQGQKTQALNKFEQAVELDSKAPLYDNNRRLTHVLLQNYDAALHGIDDVRYANILNDAGFIAKRRKDTALAQELFEAAIKASPRHHAKAQANLKQLKSAVR